MTVCVDSDIGIVVDILEVDAGAGGRGEGCLQVQLVLLHAARVEDWVGVHGRDLGGDVLAVEPQPLVEGDHTGGLQILLGLKTN